MSDYGQTSLQRPPALLDYLKQQGWKPMLDHGREEVAGLCPLHRESRPSFYVNRRKQVFYCHGCGRGGGIAQLRHWLEGYPWRSAPPCDSVQAAEMREHAYGFFEQQLRRCPEARAYLRQRGIYDPDLIGGMRIGYAPGACLRAYLADLGYRWSAMRHAGWIDPWGRDRWFRCLTFPLEEAGGLYGRSIDSGSWRHRFLPGSKGGLYGWKRGCSPGPSPPLPPYAEFRTMPSKFSHHATRAWNDGGRRSGDDWRTRHSLRDCYRFLRKANNLSPGR